MNHTKGPWRKQGNIILGAEHGRVVANVLSNHIPAGPSTALEESANASLIAACPQLFEVTCGFNLLLKSLNDIPRSELQNEPKLFEFNGRLNSLIKTTDLLIKKALGEL